MLGGPVRNRLRGLVPTISVGVSTADLLSLGVELALLEEARVRLIHVDLIDGCFCPAMTVGPPFLKGIKTSLLKDARLMVERPLGKLGEYVAAGADIIATGSAVFDGKAPRENARFMLRTISEVRQVKG